VTGRAVTGPRCDGQGRHGAEALRDATARLQAAGVEGAARDARRLLAHALGVAPDVLAGRMTDPVPEAAGATFAALVARRAAREPVSHLTGVRAFWGREFRVTRDVLDPRPETETLVALALEAPFRRVLDLGTGSGCILVTLLAERPGAQGVGTDVSAQALVIAGENAARHGVAQRLVLTPSDWFGDIGGRYDLIVSNPPYIAAEEMAGWPRRCGTTSRAGRSPTGPTGFPPTAPSRRCRTVPYAGRAASRGDRPGAGTGGFTPFRGGGA
jgi:release factor glutamine methyltransferase